MCICVYALIDNGILTVWQSSPVSKVNPYNNKYLSKACHSILTTFGLLPTTVTGKVSVTLFWFAHYWAAMTCTLHPVLIYHLLCSHSFLFLSFCFGWFLLVWWLFLVLSFGSQYFLVLLCILWFKVGKVWGWLYLLIH